MADEVRAEDSLVAEAEVSFGDGHQGQAGHEATPSEIVETSTPRGGFPASEAADGNEDKIEDWEEGEEDFEAGDGGEEGATAGQEGEDAATGDWRQDMSTAREVVTFWKATSGHRPESAEVARRIEGFDDDFKYVEQEEEEEEEQQQEEEEDTGPNYRELIEDQVAVERELRAKNSNLQKKVLMIFEKQHRQKIAEDDPKNANKLDAGYEVRFNSSAKKWLELTEEEDRVKQHYQAIIFDHNARLEERTRRSEEIRKAFRGFKLEVARSAENSKTGRPIPEGRITELDTLDGEREEEVEKLRLRNISLRAEMRKLETKIRQKEQLAEGLHLIDFEQLKIENQSLNEKIEERNEELLKLRKKTTATVQVLTHIKEKLQFVEKENQMLTDKLSALEKELIEKRDKLQRVKTERDRLRLEASRLKDNSSYVSRDVLLEDVVLQKERKEDLLQKLAELKAMHSAVTERVSVTTQKILQMTEILNTPGSGMCRGSQ